MSKRESKPIPAAEPAAAAAIATIRVELRDIEPLIWREIDSPVSITLEALHDIIQAAMGWTNSHLWEFTIGRERFGPPEPSDGFGEGPINAGKVILADILRPRRTHLHYVYDMGDNWEHRVTVSRIRAGDPSIAYPRYVAGAGACPPEDCGGFPGYYHLLEALADPRHPNHAEMKEWHGGSDPARFDDLAPKLALGQIAKRRRAARKGRSRSA